MEDKESGVLNKLRTDIEGGMRYDDLVSKYQLNTLLVCKVLVKLLQKNMLDEYTVRAFMGSVRAPRDNAKEHQTDGDFLEKLKVIPNSTRLAIAISAVICWGWITPNSWLWWIILTPIVSIPIVLINIMMAKCKIKRPVINTALFGSLCLISGILIPSVWMLGITPRNDKAVNVANLKKETAELKKELGNQDSLKQENADLRKRLSEATSQTPTTVEHPITEGRQSGDPYDHVYRSTSIPKALCSDINEFLSDCKNANHASQVQNAYSVLHATLANYRQLPNHKDIDVACATIHVHYTAQWIGSPNRLEYQQAFVRAMKYLKRGCQ